jgi:hypothetical protein
MKVEWRKKTNYSTRSYGDEKCGKATEIFRLTVTGHMLPNTWQDDDDDDRGWCS